MDEFGIGTEKSFAFVISIIIIITIFNFVDKLVSRYPNPL
jgi:hypothetical protein